MKTKESKTKVEIEFSKIEMKKILNRCREKGVSIHQLLKEEILAINE